ACEKLRGNPHQGMRETRQCREIVFRHTDKLVILAVRGDLDPLVFQQFESNLFFREKTHEFEKLLSRNRPGAISLDFDFAGRADAQLEVSRRNREAVALRFAKKIGEDGDGRLAFDNTLSEAELLQ